MREERELKKIWQSTDFDAIAKKVALESAVLLKNEQNLLPLNKEKHAAVIGAMAEKPHCQGAGSSRVNPRRVVSFVDAMHDEGLGWDYARGYSLGPDPDPRLEREALDLCGGKDAVLIFAGLRDFEESESYDRPDLELPAEQNALIERASAENPNVVVVLHAGSPVRMPWLDKVKAVLLVGLAGQMAGSAALDLLLGRANPCGKLAETWPLALEDTPAFGQFGKRFNTQYRESVFVGYRFYESFSKPVRFPFGFGLSYTSFRVSDLEVNQENLAPGEMLEVTVRLTNTGPLAGKEVVQMYIAPPVSAIFRPRKELKAFQKVELAPGESQTIHFQLKHSDFAYWNTSIHAWHTETGEYRLLVGTSAGDLPLEAGIFLTSDQPEVSVPDYAQAAPEYYAYGTGVLQVSEKSFEAVLGSPLPVDPVGEPKTYDLNSTLWDARQRVLGKLIALIVGKISRKISTGGGEFQEANDRIMEASVLDSPLRSYVLGGVRMNVAEAIALLLNGKFPRAIKKLLEKEKAC